MYAALIPLLYQRRVHGISPFRPVRVVLQCIQKNEKARELKKNFRFLKFLTTSYSYRRLPPRPLRLFLFFLIGLFKVPSIKTVLTLL
eukprot:NODE_2260_length_593_cov_93.955882_g1786_i0.p1 GENE.NODE_2260_length_593_cov_93.955882_g1786_i0~~NODE_2260_length_593_cov_93.955882_g1786_i0.p1  ORF type:complete len:87 (-),score=8.17 NODE_2260_length_593_cov_93.955882_g1786_i0:41-301(-)